MTELSTLVIPLSEDTLPPGVRRIDLEIKVAGQLITQTFSASPNQQYTFTWNGQDAYGRTVYGKQPVIARVGYVYDAVYMTPAQLDQSFAILSGVPITGIRARQEITLWQEMHLTVGTLDARGVGLGGWTFDVHHLYDPRETTLYLGNGDKRSNQIPSSLDAHSFAGTGVRGFNGDGLPSFQTQLQYPEALAVPPDNSAGLYLADSSPQIGQSRIRTFGDATTTVVGGGNCGSPDCGDGGPATQAQLSAALDVFAGSSLTNLSILYIATGERIRHVDSAGIITTVAGTGVAGYSGDNGPATQAQLRGAHGVVLSPDGSFYIADTGNHCIRRVSPTGIITTIAGTGTAGFGGDGGPAGQAQLNNPVRVAIGPDESIYLTDTGNHRIRRVGPDGIITTVAGTGVAGFNGDGGVATQAQLSSPSGIAVGPDGTLYVTDTGNNRVRRVSSEGIITTVAGNGAADSYANVPATQAHIGGPSSIALKPDGSFWIAQRDQGFVVRSSFYLPDFTLSIPLHDISSEDGRLIYSFDPNGRHVMTTDVSSGAELLKFGYDANGLLISITDQDGNVTTIERNASGNPTAIVAPFGQRTTLNLNWRKPPHRQEG